MVFLPQGVPWSLHRRQWCLSRMSPAVNPAGLTPTPMTVDQGIFYQPVQEYFQFVQNNLMFQDESNIDHIRREGRGTTHPAYGANGTAAV